MSGSGRGREGGHGDVKGFFLFDRETYNAFEIYYVIYFGGPGSSGYTDPLKREPERVQANDSSLHEIEYSPEWLSSLE